MPKLYYTPTSCGSATFIAAHIGGVKLDAETVDLATHKTASGADFYAVNPKGNVPTIVTDDGTVLNENIATLLFAADQAPGNLAPAPASPERYALLTALSYVASEVHPAVGSFFSKPTGDVLALYKERVGKKLDYLTKHFIADKQYVANGKLSVADLYLYVVLGWTSYLGGAIDLSAYPKVKAYYDHIASLESVKKAHAFIATKPATTI